jgi:hypothetical protein
MLLSWRAKKQPERGGSVFGRRKLWSERINGHNRLMRMYFNGNPTFPEHYFRRLFLDEQQLIQAHRCGGGQV